MARLAELQAAAGCELRGDPETSITGVASVEHAGPADIAPVDGERFAAAAAQSKAGAFIVPPGMADAFARPCLVSPYPQPAMNAVIAALGLADPEPAPGIHPTAAVDPGATIGEGTRVEAQAMIEPDVVIGKDCVISAGAVIRNGARLGDRVRIGENAVIARQGFGYAPGPTGPVLLVHIGHVVIEDGAHIGACATVDRARFDETRVGSMSALDAHVHVGHNAVIGARTFIAAQTGLAGRAILGSDCEIGGQAGVGGGCGTGDRCRVAGKTGVTKMWGDGVTLMDNPGRERRDVLRMRALLERLVRPDDKKKRS
ncbi:MAG: LpxD N-terminal domain-containing protein [Planctomycetota bacterium]|jgi:UDP-3-O-[3-hydroxymyristoyl] glucosamine N-acyltransferase